jgi:hypothetical protein
MRFRFHEKARPRAKLYDVSVALFRSFYLDRFIESRIVLNSFRKFIFSQTRTAKPFSDFVICTDR